VPPTPGSGVRRRPAPSTPRRRPTVPAAGPAVAQSLPTDVAGPRPDLCMRKREQPVLRPPAHRPPSSHAAGALNLKTWTLGLGRRRGAAPGHERSLARSNWPLSSPKPPPCVARPSTTSCRRSKQLRPRPSGTVGGARVDHRRRFRRRSPRAQQNVAASSPVEARIPSAPRRRGGEASTVPTCAARRGRFWPSTPSPTGSGGGSLVPRYRGEAHVIPSPSRRSRPAQTPQAGGSRPCSHHKLSPTLLT